MTKLEKRINKLKQNPRNISSSELISLLVSLGFKKHGGKGSHLCYRHPELPEIKLTIPQQRPLRVAYVKQAYKAIVRLEESKQNG